MALALGLPAAMVLGWAMVCTATSVGLGILSGLQ
jgi:hypothetical protein